MQIVVGLKQILDPEMAASDFRIDPASCRPIQGKAKLVMDSYAEYALEVALQGKEQFPDAKVIGVCVGDKSADEMLRKALALGADEVVRAWDESWSDLDAHAVAHILACVCRLVGGADLVLVGRQAGDVERGLVGPMLAEELGAVCITLGNRVHGIGENRIRVRRELEAGYAVVESPLPAVVTVTNDDGNVLRLPKVRDLMLAARKSVTAFGSAALGADPERLAPRLELRNLYQVASEGDCELIPGDTGVEQAVLLVRRLHEKRVL